VDQNNRKGKYHTLKSILRQRRETTPVEDGDVHAAARLIRASISALKVGSEEITDNGKKTEAFLGNHIANENGCDEMFVDNLNEAWNIRFRKNTFLPYLKTSLKKLTGSLCSKSWRRKDFFPIAVEGTM
jgi:hypothetical protein